MARLVHIITIFALLIYSSHSMTGDVEETHMQPTFAQTSHNASGHDQPASSHRSMPICIICLAAGVTLNHVAFPEQFTPTVTASLFDELHGKELRPPVPPPRLLI